MENRLTPRQVLFINAARCYRRAEDFDSACRCLEAAEDFSAAGALHEQAERFADAARCFERAAHWDAAARSHLANGAPVDGARCLLAAGRDLEAGWILAHGAHRFDRAQVILAGLEPETPADVLAREIALARCAVPRSKTQRAQPRVGRVLVRAADEIGDLAPGPGRDRVMAWSLALIEVLDRPDLAAQLYARAAAAGLPDAVDNWERWALSRLQTAEGISMAVAQMQGRK